MVNVVEACQYQACSTFPIFNFPDKKRGQFCVQHKSEGMVDVKNKK
jgi:hypothetical protein